ncbi:MAG TPA: lysine--tRNA ligase [Candidatus Paceibacterota bacterium]|nr:lysine--tRNA ligase [Candidatus Paceibacterota bacterium]
MPLDDFRNVRIEKLKRLRDAGIDPYPTTSRRTHRVTEALEQFDALAQSHAPVVIAGRVMAMRTHGGITFLDIDDGSGVIQALLKEDALKNDQYRLFVDAADIGDFIELDGALFTTKRGEKTVEVTGWRMLAKAIRPLPEKWHGLVDVEERYRSRPLDLLFNAEVKKAFVTRFRILDLARRFFSEHGYLEVETPILQLIPGGATAHPFATHLNTLDLELFLRVAPELYLKRLLVGGMERVFELGKNFRNEGMDREHNPEFTMLEAYAAYQDHEWLMAFTEDFLIWMATEVFGKPSFTYQGTNITLSKPFKRMTFGELVEKSSGLDYDAASVKEFAAKAKELNIVVDKAMTKANLADEIYKKTLRAKMMEPVFVVGHPLELSPLSKRVSPGSQTVARFQLIIGGFELINAFAELNDPLDQAERFNEQSKQREKGDEEAHRVDADYIETMEYGMPPAAGLGIGMDRLCALFTDSHSLRDILLFPLMKPRT